MIYIVGENASHLYVLCLVMSCAFTSFLLTIIQSPSFAMWGALYTQHVPHFHAVVQPRFARSFARSALRSSGNLSAGLSVETKGWGMPGFNTVSVCSKILETNPIYKFVEIYNRIAGLKYWYIDDH